MRYTEKQRQQIYQFREAWKKGDDARDAGLPVEIPEVKRVNDISYGPYGDYNLLDLNLPRKHDGKVPVIINIHGGGFFYGTKETYQFYCLFLAKQGFAVVNFNYRLAPDYQFPANIEDLDKVLTWVEEHADEYQLDVNNVFLVGDSAGGQMVTQYSTIYTNDNYRSLFGLRKPALTICAAATNCGGFTTDHYKQDDGGDLLNVAGLFFATHQDEAKVDLTKVEDYITKDLLPLYVMTANYDMIREQCLALDKFLTEKGIDHEFHDYGSQEEPREHVFHINQKDELAKQCNLDELRFFRQFMN